MRRIVDISKPEWDVQTPQPRVSIIVPALNEEETVEPALTSLLKLDYANYEVIAVDDRSTDRTGEIMDRLAATSNGRLRVIHIAQLPAGWLGKPHAMWLAAQQAEGDWLLFTDADVVYRPDCLPRAAAYPEAAPVVHLPLFPDLEPRTFSQHLLVPQFSTFI